jgi:hypothetical protein
MTAVRRTPELQRVLALPRRPCDGDYAELVEGMTDALSVTDRCPGKAIGPASICDVCGCPMRLRSVQALALYDIATYGGAFLPIGVGEGKTLIFALAARVLGAKKPLGLLPATLIENAERAMRKLAKHWLMPTNLRLFSYEKLGLEQYANELDEYEPDLIDADEVHRLKNLHAACTKRVARRMAKRSDTAFVGMSGTVMRDNLHDFGHIIFWALKGDTPLPIERQELDDWAGALAEPKPDRFGQEMTPTSPGALLEMCSPEELREIPLKAARLGFRRRLVETPGVVATAGDGERVDASIRITGQVYKLKDASTEERFTNLRKAMLTPDGYELISGVEVWRHARELALGFHSIWDPRPPKEWLEPRKRWGAFVRAYLARSHRLDSPDQVKQAVEIGDVDDDGLLVAWLNVKDTYEPNVVEIWHDDTVLKLCAKWAAKPGIVWTDQVFFAERLARDTGLPYFGAGGRDANGTYIEDADCSRAIIASIDANRDGKNLQGDPDRKPLPWKGFARNLLVGPPDGWDALQQTIARTHRPKQLADEVIVDVLIGCREHVTAWHRAVAGTIAARDTIGGKPKLMLADVSGFPTEDEARRFLEARW